MIIKFENFLNEGNITDVVFHRTYISSLLNIIKTEKILLSTSMGTGADVYSKKPYFLSLSRTKNLKLGYLKNSNVTIEFDGKQLKTKYKGKSIDYWQWDLSKDELGPGHSAKRRSDSDEYEDRIFSNEPYMTNLNKYIKWIDILVPIIEKDGPFYSTTWINSLKQYIVEIKKFNTPLLKKIRIFESIKDFNIGKKWVSIYNYNPSYEPDEDWGVSDKYFGQLDFRLLNKVITILLMGDKNINDKEYLRKEIQKYYDKFIKLGAEKLKNVTEDEIKSLIWSIQQKDEWEDREFLHVTNSDVHGLGKSSSKSEINYEILKLLSDEMIKYKVTNVKDLIDMKRGVSKKTNTKLVNYSKIFGFVYKNYDRYVLLDCNSKQIYFLKWTHLKEDVRNKIYDSAYQNGNGYGVTIKDVINTIFNLYNEDKAIELIKSINDNEYKFVDLRNKLIYKEITEKDYIGDDIGHRSCWMYVDNGNWVLFIQNNISEEKFKQIYPKVRKLAEDNEVKIRFIWSVTEKLLGEEKTLKFFDENNLIPLKDDKGEYKKYLINIGEQVKKKEPEYAN